jgi:hypothetical protein
MFTKLSPYFQDSDRARLLLENIRISVEKKLLSNEFLTDLHMSLTNLPISASHETKLVHIQKWIAISGAEYLTEVGRSAFNRTYPAGFGFVRVVNSGTYNSCYATVLSEIEGDELTGEATDNPLAAISRGPVSANDTIDSAKFDNPENIRSLRTRIKLHSPNGRAWITSLDWWDTTIKCEASGADALKETKATWAVLNLALPYPAPFDFVALKVKASAVSWSVCEKPSVFHAHIDGVQPWYKIWETDDASQGSTVNLHGLFADTPQIGKGAPEWVAQFGEVETDGNVEVEILGCSTASNDPSGSDISKLSHYETFLKLAA